MEYLPYYFHALTPVRGLVRDSSKFSLILIYANNHSSMATPYSTKVYVMLLDFFLRAESSILPLINHEIMTSIIGSPLENPNINVHHWILGVHLLLFVSFLFPLISSSSGTVQ